MDILSSVEAFDWDEGNIKKNWERHRVSHIECEEVFFNNPLVAREDKPHSTAEDRFYVLGKTDKERLLFVVFTIRSNKIRVISARDMNRKRLKGGQFFIIVAKKRWGQFFIIDKYNIQKDSRKAGMTMYAQKLMIRIKKQNILTAKFLIFSYKNGAVV